MSNNKIRDETKRIFLAVLNIVSRMCAQWRLEKSDHGQTHRYNCCWFYGACYYLLRMWYSVLAGKYFQFNCNNVFLEFPLILFAAYFVKKMTHDFTHDARLFTQRHTTHDH